jgi:septum site-determining protein MinC
MAESITIKGISQGVLATLSEEDGWEDLVGDLIKLIDRQNAFFRGAQLVLDVNGRRMSSTLLDDLKDLLHAREVSLAAILSTDDDTLVAAAECHLWTDLADVEPPTLPERPPEVEELQGYDSEEYGTAGVLIKRTLRSGRTVTSRGHVVVIGDVNSGAEIVAIGDVIVWGKLRGTVHAGAQGDESAVVCALDLAPTQLRIANLITVPPQDKRKKSRPEMALVAEGQIEAVPWLP